jgi:hypothetical protein
MPGKAMYGRKMGAAKPKRKAKAKAKAGMRKTGMKRAKGY